MNLVYREPVLTVGTVLNMVIIMFTSFVLPKWFNVHPTATDVAAVTTISTAATAMVATFLTTPVNIGVISGCVTTILVAAAAFGLKLSPHELAWVSGAVVAVLGYLLREKVSPSRVA